MLLTDEAIQKRQEVLFKFHAAIQGIEIDGDEKSTEEDDLPPEFYEQDKAMKAARGVVKSKEELEAMDLGEIGLGYQVAKKDSP